MSDRELVHQLSELKTVKSAPAVWRAGARERLLAQIDRQPSTSFTLAESFQLGLMRLRLRVAPVRLAPVFAVLALVFIVSVPFTSAMQSSLPGNSLYTLKRSFEQLQLSFFNNTAERQGVAYLTLANHRLDELARLPVGSTYQAQVLRDYNIALGFAQAGLHAAPLSSRLGAVYDDTLTVLGEQLHITPVGPAAQPAYLAALGLTDRLTGESLAFLVAAHQSGANGVLPQALSQRLEQQIAKVEAKLDGVDGKIRLFPTSKSAARVVLESRQIIVPVREARQLAKDSLTQAKALVEQNQFTLALEKVQEGEDITAKAEAAVDKEAAAGKVEGASTNTETEAVPQIEPVVPPADSSAVPPAPGPDATTPPPAPQP